MYDECLELFIDELGVPTIDPLYVVTSASIKETDKTKVRILADQIKFKYWGRTDIVFHSREIGHCLNDFRMFKNDEDLKKAFHKDLYLLLGTAPIMLMSVVIDREKAQKKGWIQRNKYITESAQLIFRNFAMILYCKSKTRGKIIIEVDSAKEKSYLESFSKLLGQGVPRTKIKSKDIRDIITSISFVTKKNYDIETQLMDLFSYAIRCKYLEDSGKENYSTETYERNIIDILEKKLYRVPPNASVQKKRILNKVKSFAILP